MRLRLLLLLLSLPLLFLDRAAAQEPGADREFRGVWMASVANIDWPSRRGLSPEELKREYRTYLDVFEQARLNAIILQVRPSCDALYASHLEPWTEFLTGTQGKAPAHGFDPLAFAIEEAHARDLELHAWFNPFRAKHVAAKGKLAPGHIARRQPGWVKTYGSYLWLDPGREEVRAYTLDVILDVVRRYDIDGVHLDDYFYPYPSYAKGQPFPDDDSYTAYREKGGLLNRDAWRLAGVDELVEQLYTRVKERKPWLRVGISPFGIYRPGIPEGIAAGIDQVAELYADPLRWMRRGHVDYLSPQLYWPIDQKAQAFPVLHEWWEAQSRRGCAIWPGLFTSKVIAEKGTWPVKEILDQIGITRTQTKSPGQIHFSAKALLKNPGLTSALGSGPYRKRALPPAVLGASRPAEAARTLEHAPRVSVTEAEDTFRIEWAPRAEGAVHKWAFYVRTTSGWHLDQKLSADTTKLYLTRNELKRRGIDRVGVAALSRGGHEGERGTASVAR